MAIKTTSIIGIHNEMMSKSKSFRESTPRTRETRVKRIHTLRMKNKKNYIWISATLQNDESSTDDELISYFIDEGNMERKEAEFYVKQRQDALSSPKFKLKHYKVKN